MKYLLLGFLLLCAPLVQGQYDPDNTDFRPPLDIPIILAGTFGELRSNHFHAGVDIKTQQREGLPVLAIEDGTVSRIKVSHWGYGKALYVAHPNGYTSVYAHLQKFGPEIEAYIKKLQYEKQSYEVETFPDYGTLTVKKGQILAYSGNTGGSSGPHLHFEIRNSMDEKPTNPLLYGLEVRDATNPTLEGLYGYPLSEGAQVNRSAERIQLSYTRQADGSYLADTVRASGRIGFGIKAYDRQDMAANKNGVFRIRQIVDGKTYTDLDFESFSFGETRYINTLIDYPYYARHRSRIQKCFKDSGNRLSIYNTLFNDGILEVVPGNKQQVELHITDLAGNSTLLRIPVEGRKEAILNRLQNTQTPYYIRADKPASFELGKAKVYFPSESFYENAYLNLTATGDTVAVHEPTLPLHRNFTLSFDVSDLPSEQRRQSFIARLDAVDHLQYVRTYKRGNTFSTRQRELGRYTLAMDTVPPKIKPKNFKPRQWLTNYRYLSLRISDDLSGISDYVARLNGKWILMEYEPKTRTITYNFDDQIGDDRQCELEVVVTDNSGNTSKYTATIFRR